MWTRIQRERKRTCQVKANVTRLRVFFLLFTAFVGPMKNAAYAADFGGLGAAEGSHLEEDFRATDRGLFLELVKLAKFNIRFHLEANRHQKWRDLTYPILRESGTAVSLATTIIDISQQARGIENLAQVNRNALKNAVTCGIVGSAINGSASALELAQNSWMMYRAKRMGYSPARSLAFVKTIVANTDVLLNNRDQLIAQVRTPERRRVLELETRLIRRMRQQLLFEFGAWSCHSRDQAWRENTFYTLDALQSFTRMGAAITAMHAFGSPELGRGAAITSLVGNSVATLNPIVKDLVGIAVRKHQERKLAREIPFERPTRSDDLDHLQQQLVADTQEIWLRKVAALNYRSDRIDIALDREIKDIERYRQIAQQQTISGPLIGLTGVASSTLATVAVYGYLREPDTAIRLGLSGRITQCTGQVYALVNTPYTMIHGMIRKHRLRKRGELPSQILEARLKKLEELDHLPPGTIGSAVP